MKKAFVFSFILFFNSYLFAQFDTEPDIKYKWGIGVAINSIQAQVEIPIMSGSGAQIIDADGNIITGGNREDKSYSISIVPKYHIKNNVQIRFEYGLTKLNLVSNSNHKLNQHTISYREVNNKINRYNIGFQWMFVKTFRLESYFGLTGTYVNYSDISSTSSFENRDLVSDTLLFKTKTNEITPGGYATGISGLTGFNIYLSNRFSIGAELSSTALYYKIGGKGVSETEELVAGNPSVSYSGEYANSYKGFKISKIMSSFNFTVRF